MNQYFGDIFFGAEFDVLQNGTVGQTSSTFACLATTRAVTNHQYLEINAAGCFYNCIGGVIFKVFAGCNIAIRKCCKLHQISLPIVLQRNFQLFDVLLYLTPNIAEQER